LIHPIQACNLLWHGNPQIQEHPRSWSWETTNQPPAQTSGKGNLQMIKKLHFVLIFLQISTFLCLFPELTPELYKTIAFHHVPIQC
jgi:hypothetical protein